MENNNTTFEQVEQAYAEWSLKTFDTSAVDSLHGLLREVHELEIEFALPTADEDDALFEIADCFMYLIYAYRRAGYTLPQIIDAIHRKTAVNKKRQWKKNCDGTYSHVKEGGVAFNAMEHENMK